jgi:transcriptional regulator with XRE-family HTH domain
MAIFRKEADGDSIKPAAFNVPRPLTAAAVQVKLNDKGEAELFKERKNSADAQWQSEAWEYYDAIGEIKYSFQLVANIVSRIRLYPAVVNDASEAPVGVDLSPDFDPKLAEAAQRALSRLDSAYGGQAGLLRDAALNLSVTGECYLVQVPERIGSGLPETWDIRSVDELHQNNSGQFYVNSRRQKSGSAFGPGATASNIIPLPVGSFMGRIWRSHPRYSDEPDSSLRGILDLCEELLLLNRTFRATAKSRLNAGALYIPDGLSASNGIDPDMVGADEDGIFPEEAADEFEEQLIDAMTTPVTDESSASAVVPLIIRGPADLGDKIKQFKFERSFDAELAKRSDRVLERILQGLDIPKDVVTGLASVKYCLSDDTEILSQRGWLSVDELTLTDKVLTLNRVTGQSEWQHPTAVNVFDVAAEDRLLSLESGSHSSLSTMNHGWHVRRQTSLQGQAVYDWVDTTSASMVEKSNMFIPTAFPHAELPVVKTYSDEFVKLVAWWYTEGHLRENSDFGKFDVCVDRSAWKSFLTDARKKNGLSRRALAQKMGKHVSNSNAASGHIVHVESKGAVTVEERTELASALSVSFSAVEQFFTARVRPKLGSISQSLRVNPEYVEAIRDVLVAMCDNHGASNGLARGRVGESWWTERYSTATGMVTFTLSDAVVDKIVSVCSGSDKIVSLSFISELTADQLEMFIDVSIAADGHERVGDGRRSITQKVSERLDALELAVVLSGRTPIRRAIQSNGFKPAPAYELTIKGRDFSALAAMKKEVVSVEAGRVWCPTTLNGSWLARRNGKVFYTLNSNAVQIDESLYKAHIEPLLLLISDALTVVYLRPYLRGIGFSELEVSKVVVWYDPSSVATRNDRASDADSGFDKLAISSQTWRRAHGFSETDAPDPTELALRLLTQRASFTPELTEALLTAIAPELIASARAASQAASVAPVPANIAEALAGEAPSAEGVDSAVAPPESSDPVEPGEDAPPFPLAEPKV